MGIPEKKSNFNNSKDIHKSNYDITFPPVRRARPAPMVNILDTK